jgi:hypothetical protein
VSADTGFALNRSHDGECPALESPVHVLQLIFKSVKFLRLLLRLREQRRASQALDPTPAVDSPDLVGGTSSQDVSLVAQCLHLESNQSGEIEKKLERPRPFIC